VRVIAPRGVQAEGDRRGTAPHQARQIVVDLGSVPGAWSQYVRRRFAPKEVGAGGAAAGALNGTIIALDVLPMEPIEGVVFLQGDIREEPVLAELEAVVAGRPVDVVVSDMRPTLGHRERRLGAHHSPGPNWRSNSPRIT